MGTLPSIIWAGLACYVIYCLRDILPAIAARLSAFEAFGLKLSLLGGQALSAAVELATKQAGAPLVVPEADRRRALDRANRERRLFEGAEILWVDDFPSNNRNEARMLRSFGALITFAATTAEALQALRYAVDQAQPFDLIISDIARELPAAEPQAGLVMLEALREKQVTLPVIFYIARLRAGGIVPLGAFGITNRPDQLLQLVTDILSRTRSPA